MEMTPAGGTETGAAFLLAGLVALLVLAALYMHFDAVESSPTIESAPPNAGEVGEIVPVNDTSAASDNALLGENARASENGTSENMRPCENEQVTENEMTSENAATRPTLAELRVVLDNIEIPEELNFDIYHFINTWENTVSFLERHGIPYHVGEELAGNGKPMLYSDNWYWTIFNPKDPGGWYTVQKTFAGTDCAKYLQRQLDEAGFRAGFAGVYISEPTDPQAFVAVETADRGVVLVSPSVYPEYRYVYTNFEIGGPFWAENRVLEKIHIWWSDGEEEIWE